MSVVIYETKYCKGCDKDHHVEKFGKNIQTKDGLSVNCRKFINAYNKKYIKSYTWKNPKKGYNDRRDQIYKSQFGISLQDYEKMLTEQNGVCYICKLLDPAGRRLSIDHDHETGKVRGLLCAHCNHGLGNFKDDIELLRKAIDYLLKHKQ